MFEAQLLKTIDASQSAVSVFSPWFPRQADNMTCTLDVVEVSSGNAQIDVRVFTKNTEDAGDGTDADVSTVIQTSSVGRSADFWVGKTKELVRYEFTIRSVAEEPGPFAEWVLFRMLPPVWFDSVEA